MRGTCFQKPFEFPRPGPLLTPPDTDSEYQGQSQALPTISSAIGLGIELEPPVSHRSPSVTEVPISRKLQYIQSGPREARERTVQRGVRWLVVVTPPLTFAQERGHFGHTLAIGSPERLSQGLLMPLFQTVRVEPNSRFLRTNLKRLSSDEQPAEFSELSADWKINPSQIKLFATDGYPIVLGKGGFGTVLYASVFKEEAAVKIIKTRHGDDRRQQAEVLKEMTIMERTRTETIVPTGRNR